MVKVRDGPVGKGENELIFDPDELDKMPVVELDGPMDCAYSECGARIRDDGSRAIQADGGRFYCSDGCQRLDTEGLGKDAPTTSFVRIKYK
jgi:hypothetical protein